MERGKVEREGGEIRVPLHTEGKGRAERPGEVRRGWGAGGWLGRAGC